ncbi:acrosin-like [Xenopus laevis]|uniref:Acrosin-like n=1 Tax=Xenopus laevis TaxID=8355 RepID=A0A8J1MC45_XENLA|nr:acrosin-like [Xenopus laevis]
MAGAEMELLLFFLTIFHLFQQFETSNRIICGNRPLYESFYWSQEVNGVSTAQGKWPWLVSIQQKEGDRYEHICAGIILNTQWVVTAAHCFNNLNGENTASTLRLVFGIRTVTADIPQNLVRKLQKIIRHEEYNPQNAHNDIALIQVDKPIEFNSESQVACIPMPSAQLQHFTECYIAGWGSHDESAEPVRIMQEAKVEQIDAKVCNGTKWYKGRLGDSNLCASQKAGATYSCQGDSAGPLMCKGSKAQHFSVVGIASWGSGCGGTYSPGVYTSVQKLLPWIIDKVISEERKSNPIVMKSNMNGIVPYEDPQDDVTKEPETVPTIQGYKPVKNRRKRFALHKPQQSPSFPMERVEPDLKVESPHQEVQPSERKNGLKQIISVARQFMKSVVRSLKYLNSKIS